MPIQIMLFKLFLSSGACLAFYWCLLRNRAMHGFNRIFLLTSILFSLLVSCWDLPALFENESPVTELVYRNLSVVERDAVENEAAMPDAVSVAGKQRWNMAYVIWFAGAILLLLRFLLQAFRLQQMKKRAKPIDAAGIPVYLVQDRLAPFVFWRTIYWQEGQSFDEPVAEMMLQHEEAHVKLGHRWDILLCELVKLICWFNPFHHLIQKELSVIHEYQADAAAARRTGRFNYAETLLQLGIERKRAGMAIPFFVSPLKRRIMQLVKTNHADKYSFRKWLSLPFLLFILATMMMSAGKRRGNLSTILKSPITVVLDAGHGGRDDGAVFKNGLKESDLNLRFTLKIAEKARAADITVILTRNTEALPNNIKDPVEALRYRSAMSNQTGADLFLSVHIDAAPDGVTGMNVYIPSENKNPSMFNASQRAGGILLAALSDIYQTQQQLLQSKEKNIWVLGNSTIPALLMHCGNLNSPKDLAFFTQPANQDKVADAVVKALLQLRKK